MAKIVRLTLTAAQARELAYCADQGYGGGDAYENKRRLETVFLRALARLNRARHGREVADG